MTPSVRLRLGVMYATLLALLTGAKKLPPDPQKIICDAAEGIMNYLDSVKAGLKDGTVDIEDVCNIYLDKMRELKVQGEKFNAAKSPATPHSQPFDVRNN